MKNAPKTIVQKYPMNVHHSALKFRKLNKVIGIKSSFYWGEIKE